MSFYNTGAFFGMSNTINTSIVSQINLSSSRNDGIVLPTSSNSSNSSNIISLVKNNLSQFENIVNYDPKNNINLLINCGIQQITLSQSQSLFSNISFPQLISISNDGKYISFSNLVLDQINQKQLYYINMSFDYGQTFVKYPVNFFTSLISMSSNGLTQICVDKNSKSIYRFDFIRNNWFLFQNVISVPNLDISCISNDGTIIVVSNQDGDIFTFLNGNWIEQKNLLNSQLTNLLIDQSNKIHYLFSNKLYKSDSITGVINPNLTILPNDFLNYLCIDQTSNYIYIISGSGNFYRSIDGGKTWKTPKNIQNVQVQNAQGIMYINITCDYSGQYIVAVFYDNIYISSDYGETFSLQIVPTDNYLNKFVSISGDHSTIIITKSDSSGNSTIYKLNFGNLKKV
jgi:hypothetical protein